MSDVSETDLWGAIWGRDEKINGMVKEIARLRARVAELEEQLNDFRRLDNEGYATIIALRFRAERAEARMAELNALHDVSLAACATWKACAERAEAERDRWREAAGGIQNRALSAEAERDKMREELTTIADWDKVPIMEQLRENARHGEGHSLLDIILSICECARAALAQSATGAAVSEAGQATP